MENTRQVGYATFDVNNDEPLNCYFDDPEAVRTAFLGLLLGNITLISVTPPLVVADRDEV